MLYFYSKCSNNFDYKLNMSFETYSERLTTFIKTNIKMEKKQIKNETLFITYGNIPKNFNSRDIYNDVLHGLEQIFQLKRDEFGYILGLDSRKNEKYLLVFLKFHSFPTIFSDFPIEEACLNKSLTLNIKGKICQCELSLPYDLFPFKDNASEPPLPNRPTDSRAVQTLLYYCDTKQIETNLAVFSQELENFLNLPLKEVQDFKTFITGYSVEKTLKEFEEMPLTTYHWLCNASPKHALILGPNIEQNLVFAKALFYERCITTKIIGPVTSDYIPMKNIHSRNDIGTFVGLIIHNNTFKKAILRLSSAEPELLEFLDQTKSANFNADVIIVSTAPWGNEGDKLIFKLDNILQKKDDVSYKNG